MTQNTTKGMVPNKILVTTAKKVADMGPREEKSEEVSTNL